MDDFLNISTELHWDLGKPTCNDILYCTTSTGLNSPVLFYHFLLFAIKSNCKIHALIANSTFNDVSSICKRNGINIENYLESKQLTLISVSQLESNYSTSNECISIKNYNNEQITQDVKQDELTDSKYIKTSFDKCFSDLINAVCAEEDRCTSHFVIVDDILSLHYQNDEISHRIRQLRSCIENTFSNYSLVLCHPCGLDSNLDLYHQLVHMSSVQFLLMPLSTGHSQNVHGSLVVHSDVVDGSFRSVTVRRHIKITDCSAKLMIPGSI